uniref:UPF0102 protein UV11_C0021G0011 n=1 Tax=Candidatus Giovannonibacteria bacterium GW2011_GWF2_42_19 TaxID=1618659 RepID=A0A0G0ZE31_9BACT|nr:MAG: hypothetical protein UV11_C0021G0011 [Candidatus Giovannonibacteria bacterium GW2011_GWF2_42_19]
MPSPKRKIGDICEALVKKRLEVMNFTVLESNYLRKWGEIDIIALEPFSRETWCLHFIEVKGSVSREIGGHGFSREIMPEANVHGFKIRRLWRAIQTWLAENPKYSDFEWQIDVAAVFVDFNAKKAKIRWTRNIIL